MRSLFIGICLAIVSSAIAGQHAVLAAGTSDAAQLCQQGGYSHLTGITGSGQAISFKNEGACVSYAAQGGRFVTPSTCSVTSSTGCLSFSDVTLISPTTGATITLNGVTSFTDTCTPTPPATACGYALPNTLATGGGSYVLTDATGTVVSQGQYRVADTAGFAEGLFETMFTTSSGTPTTCPAATEREVDVDATLVDGTTGTTRLAQIIAQTSSDGLFLNLGFVNDGSDVLNAPVPLSTIGC